MRRSTTERYPPTPREPDYKKFCRQVIRTIAENAEGDNFLKVSMYQEIYYLISKYNIPVDNHQTDIVFIVDKLCKNDGSFKRNVPHIDNTIEDLETNSFVYHSDTSGEDAGSSSDYSSVAKFPKFPLEPPSTTARPVEGVYVSQLGEQFPAGFVKHQDFLFYPTQIQRKPESPAASPGSGGYPRVAYSGPVDSQQSTEREKEAVEPITLYPDIDVDSVKSVSFLDNQPQVRELSLLSVTA